MCRTNHPKMNCDSAIGQHLITNPKCAITYTYDSSRITGKASSSFHLIVLESVYIKTETQSCINKKSSFSHLGSSSKQVLIGYSKGRLDALFVISCVSTSGYIFRFTFLSLSNFSYSDECRMKTAFSMYKNAADF